MPDLNHLLLLLAFGTPVIVLVRTARQGKAGRAWRLAAWSVLIVTSAAWLVAPAFAGYAGGGAWMLLLMLPAGALRRAADASANHRWGRARWILDVVRPLHPAIALREHRTLFRALELAGRDRTDEAMDLLEMLARSSSATGVLARGHALRLRQNWAGIIEWAETLLPRFGLAAHPGVMPLYLRALGETGMREKLVAEFSARAPAMLASPHQESAFDSALLCMLAFCGRTRAVRRLLDTRLAALPLDVKEFWMATAEANAGDETQARSRLDDLVKIAGDAVIRREARLRGASLRGAPPAPLSPAAESTVQRFERSIAGRRISLLAPARGARTPAVWCLIALTVAVFLGEIFAGGSMNSIVLHRLGALEPRLVWRGSEFWRVIAALFLHYGPLHLLLNVYPLYILGRPLEAAIGSCRFLAAYLLAGIGSGLGVVMLWRFGMTQADLLVGASGSVMGLVGVWGGLLLRHRAAPLAGRTLLILLVIVGVQTAFDLSTPQISMAAHLCGLAAGLLLGLVIGPREKPERPPDSVSG